MYYDDNEKRPIQDAALDKLKIDSGNLNDVVPLGEVYEGITKDLGRISEYQDSLKSISNPTVSGDWYRLGGVGADQINDVLSNIVQHVKTGFDMISGTERSQSESLKNILEILW